MKSCNDCSKTLPVNNYHKKPRNKDGYDIRCKSCRNYKYNKQSPRRVFAKLYNSQVTHSVTRGHLAPSYTLDELKEWVDQQVHAFKIWEAYVSSGYNTLQRPSIDRLDDSKPYTLDNIQLMTWDENRKKGATSKKTGDILTVHKPVTAYTKQGHLQHTFISVSEALRYLGGGSMHGITSVANGVRIKDGRGSLYMPHTYKGFVWKWM